MATKGLGEDAGQGVDLLLQQEAGVGGEIRGGADDGALGAVRGAEGVEHEDVAVGGEGLGDLGVVLLLALVKADVLEAVALGAAEVAHEDDLGALVLEVLDRGDRGADAGVVRDDAILQGDVEVHAHEDALARDVGVADGLLGEGHAHSFVWFLRERGAAAAP